MGHKAVTTFAHIDGDQVLTVKAEYLSDIIDIYAKQTKLDSDIVDTLKENNVKVTKDTREVALIVKGISGQGMVSVVTLSYALNKINIPFMFKLSEEVVETFSSEPLPKSSFKFLDFISVTYKDNKWYLPDSTEITPFYKDTSTYADLAERCIDYLYNNFDDITKQENS